MKKIILFSSVFFAFIFSSCSTKHGIGLVNNQLVTRDWFGDFCMEKFIGYRVSNTFNYSKYPSGMYSTQQSDNGEYFNSFELGISAYYRFYANDILDVSAGLSYTDRILVEYKEAGSVFENYNYFYYTHKKFLSIDYANNHSFALVFPDLEIKTPFEGLKFMLKADLLRISIHLKGGFVEYATQESNDTENGYYESWSYGVLAAPGRIYYTAISSSYLNLGNITLCLIYYFK